MEIRGVFGIDQDRITRGAVQRIDFGVDERIELFAATCADFKGAGNPVEGRQRHGTEVSPAVGSGELPVRAQVPTAVLEGVAGFLQALDAVVERDELGDLFADGLAGLASEQRRAPRVNRRRKFAENFPFRFRFSSLSLSSGYKIIH